MSLTVGAIVGGIGSAISNIGQGALTIIRIIAIVGFATIFAGFILALVGLLTNFTMTSVIGEFLAIVSLCLPFYGFGLLDLGLQQIDFFSFVSSKSFRY